MVMFRCIGVVGFLIHVDVQRDPVAAILIAVAVGLTLWFIVARARRREERRAESGAARRDPPYPRR
jgi:hypothetical protein